MTYKYEDPTRLQTRCSLCAGPFTMGEWDNRHSDDNDEDCHEECCEAEGPCSRHE